jgi:predicted CXXCH cytochrome family protein
VNRTRRIKVIACLCLLFGPLLSFRTAAAQVGPPPNPRSAKACAICHFRWVDTFFIHGRGSELVPYQSEPVAATPKMCDSCHDGSVMDSRKRMIEGKGHKTDAPPPAGMEIPEIFPLDENGRMQCATCHTAHGVPSDAGEETKIFLRTSNKNSTMCRMCHAGMNGASPGRNHVMGAVEQEIPSEIFQASQTTPKRDRWIACETCHTSHGSRNEAYLIESYRNSQLCLTCHRDKSVTTPEGWRNPGHVVNVQPITAVIPPQLLEKGAETGPRGEIICNTCHMVHQVPTDQNLLVIEQDRQSTLCLTCHSDKQSIAETTHNLGRTAPSRPNLQGMTVSQDGVCSACHLPHKAALALKEGGDYISRACLSCHGTGEFSASKRLTSGHSHPLEVSPYEGKIPGVHYDPVGLEGELPALPLYNAYGVRQSGGKMRCTTCHDPHRRTPGSPPGSAQKASKSDFLRKTGGDLCRQCHSGKFSIQSTKHNLQETAPESRNLMEQKPAEAGLCGNCHLVHGGQRFFLWSRPIPEAPESAPPPLCLSCHREGGVAAKRSLHGSNHPVNIEAGQASSASGMPLFDPEGRLAENGRIACYTCHDPHRWDPHETSLQSKAITAEGHAGDSFLRLKNTPAPDLCGSCHRDQAYVARNDHNLLITAAESRNALGQQPKFSGPCGTCHLPHNSNHDVLLWAREIPRAANVVEGLCRSCHSSKNPAADKIPAIASHPQDMVFSNTERHRMGQKDYFPLFDPATAEQVLNGVLTCSSCHNSHRWAPHNQKQEEHGIQMEGDSSNSFLRNRSFNTICVDCHGAEALYRYQYFHDAAKRNAAAIQTPASGLRITPSAGVR